MGPFKVFNSKILLFGEYSIILKSKGLAIPYELFGGSLNFPPQEELRERRDEELAGFLSYVQDLSPSEQHFLSLDTTTLEFDINQGLRFQSSIPQGFGLGSSGALCAALYHAYAQEKTQDLAQLKGLFALMESYFHGASSGFDPMVSYLNRPILFDNGAGMKLIDAPSPQEGEGAIFILNTGRARRTEPLVNLFLEKLKLPDFNRLCEEQLKPLTEHCITSFLGEHFVELLNYFQELSALQMLHFGPMIPTLFKKIWQQGLDSGDYALKLCGAGGGGFLLGISPDIKKTQAHLPAKSLRLIYRFDPTLRVSNPSQLWSPTKPIDTAGARSSAHFSPTHQTPP